MILRNVSSQPNKVTLKLRASEQPPAGARPIADTPALVIRGALDTGSLTHAAIAFDEQHPYELELAASGEPGSAREIVIGVNRAELDVPKDAFIAGIISVEDSVGQTRSHLSASTQGASDGGLWVGEAQVSKVGQYLLDYPKAFDQAALSSLALSNDYNNLSLPATSWALHRSGANLEHVVASENGEYLLGAGSPGRLYTSADGGETWARRSTGRTDGDRHWSSLATSASGSNLVAVVDGGKIWTSIDAGLNWIEQAAGAGLKSWKDVASSADGLKLVAVADSEAIYTSTDGGFTWMARDSSRSWRTVCSSADGSRLIASTPTELYVSADSGATWTTAGFPAAGIQALV